MKKLKLQMQMSVDGFVSGPNGELDWITWNWDEPLKKFVNEFNHSSDTILLGRKMTDGFVQHWEGVVNNPPKETDDTALRENYEFAKLMVDLKKIVFSKSQKTINGKNTSITNDNIVEVVNRLKKENGKDIVVYGGAGFVSSLITESLIDELNLFINPTAIGNGLRIFHETTKLDLLRSTKYDCGIVVNVYKPGV